MPRAPKIDRTLPWYCVHDRAMRQLYLGTDKAEADRLTVDGAIMRTGRSAGDAMRATALAWGEERQRRPGGR